MKYICLGFTDEKKWEAMPDTDRHTFIDQCFLYDDTLRRDGHFIGGEALQSTRNTVVLEWRNGRVAVTDGPYAETKEQLGGIMMLEAADLNDAVRLMSNHPSLRLGGGRWEIRPSADLDEMMGESRTRQVRSSDEE